VNGSNDNIRVVIPLTIRRRNGRPKILPPENVGTLQTRAQEPHIIKALGRAWAWRRKLEKGEMATVGDIAKAEKVTDRFVSRTMRLAYMSPKLLERLVIGREPPSVSLNDIIEATYLSWMEQVAPVFNAS